MERAFRDVFAVLSAFAAVLAIGPEAAGQGLQRVNHIIIVMQENHSFDNYFGVLPYAPGTPYHPGSPSCSATDHQCVNGLRCTATSGGLKCSNWNLDDNKSIVRAFHDPSRCVAPDLDHGWVATHTEGNYTNPNGTLTQFPADGFVRWNDQYEQVDSGTESATEDQTIGYYDQTDLPFYYDLAQKFAISDRHFASVLGPTFPNRAYLLAATSFGHLTTNEIFPPPGGYKPITGTIFDLLDKNNVTWADYFQDVPQGASFRNVTDSHFQPLSVFMQQAAGSTTLPPLPSVVFVDPDFGVSGRQSENDEHPPTDIQRGQASVSNVVNAIRNGPYWKDSIIFLTYDEHGGFYDHMKPPPAPQGGQRTPDGIAPGQCADLSNPPSSEQPGGGAECATNPLSTTDTSVKDAEALCSALASDPTGPYPSSCASFDQYGVRVPFIAISPFAKPAYVSHIMGDHTSMLALIERRFLSSPKGAPQHLTLRDRYANPLEDMFDFVNAPSMNTTIGTAALPATDCTPAGGGGVP